MRHVDHVSDDGFSWCGVGGTDFAGGRLVDRQVVFAQACGTTICRVHVMEKEGAEGYCHCLHMMRDRRYGDECINDSMFLYRYVNDDADDDDDDGEVR